MMKAFKGCRDMIGSMTMNFKLITLEQKGRKNEKASTKRREIGFQY